MIHMKTKDEILFSEQQIFDETDDCLNCSFPGYV